MPRAYDSFLARVRKAPIVVCSEFKPEALAPDDGSNGPQVAVLRIEFDGFRRSPVHGVITPYVAEVFSCGHRNVEALGSINWRRPRRFTTCSDCREMK